MCNIHQAGQCSANVQFFFLLSLNTTLIILKCHTYQKKKKKQGKNFVFLVSYIQQLKTELIWTIKIFGLFFHIDLFRLILIQLRSL